MVNPACEKCRPDKPETHDQISRDSGCDTQYQSVKRCMEENQGNVSDCRAQWSEFRSCFKVQKDKEKEKG